MWTETLTEEVETEFEEMQQFAVDDKEKIEAEFRDTYVLAHRANNQRHYRRHKAKIVAKKWEREQERYRTDPEFRARRLRQKRESYRRRKAR